MPNLAPRIVADRQKQTYYDRSGNGKQQQDVGQRTLDRERIELMISNWAMGDKQEVSAATLFEVIGETLTSR